MYSESFILFRESAWGDEHTGQISHVTFRRKHRPRVVTPFITSDGCRSRCNGGNTVKRIGIIQTTTLFLLLGICFPADAGQEKPEKQEEKAKPERQKQDQQAKPEQKRQAKGQQDQQRQQRDSSAKQQRQDNSAKQQQQARAQQDQQRQQRDNSAKQEQQQAKTQQQEQRQQQQDKSNKHEQQIAKGQQDQLRQQQQRQDSSSQRQEQARAQHNQQGQQRQQQGNRSAQQRSPSQAHQQQVAWQGDRARSWKSEHRTWQQRGGYNGYRIPDDRFRSHYGRDHGFRIYSLPVRYVGGHRRFQYGGYWFGLIDPWPEYWSNDWYDSDDVYVAYYGDGYYLYNRRYPSDRIAISFYVN
jgi:hypothetical protein